MRALEAGSASTSPLGDGLTRETRTLVDELISLGVTDAAAAIARREVSATELTTACLDRIREADGTHSHDGDPGSINAWVRVYEEDAVSGGRSRRRTARRGR